jgi:hypothetical protein
MNLKTISPPFFEKIDHSNLNHQTPAKGFVHRNDLNVLYHANQYRGLKKDEDHYPGPLIVEHEDVYDIGMETFNNLWPTTTADCKKVFSSGQSDWNCFLVSDYNLASKASTIKDPLLYDLMKEKLQPFIGGLNDYDMDGRPYIYVLVSQFIEEGDAIIENDDTLILTRSANEYNDREHRGVNCISDDSRHYSYLCIAKIRVNDFRYEYFNTGKSSLKKFAVLASERDAKNAYADFIHVLRKFKGLTINNDEEFIALALDLHNYNLSKTTITIDSELRKKVSLTVSDLNHYLRRYTTETLTAVDLVKYVIRMNYRSFTPGLMHKKWVKDVLAEKRVYRNFVKRFNTYLRSPSQYSDHINERMTIYMNIKGMV